MLNRLSQSLEFHGEALRLRAERQRLLASNIANGDTPGYVARDLDFKASLSQALGQMPSLKSSLAATAAGHVSRPLAGTEDPRMVYAMPSQSNLDGNTVDMDRERAAFADNSVKYEATLRFINGSGRTLLDAIKGQ
jgi:flagellar basal-body rod protein FlgB